MIIIIVVIVVIVVLILILRELCHHLHKMSLGCLQLLQLEHVKSCWIVRVVVVVVILILHKSGHHQHQLCMCCHQVLHLGGDIVVVRVGIGTSGRHLWFSIRIRMRYP